MDMSHLMNDSSRAGQALLTTVKTWATGNTIKLLGRETWNSMRIILILLILCGVVYPLILFGVGQFAFNEQANGSLITDAHGQVIGSRLIGQYWTKPQYFHGRPSATVNPSTGRPEAYNASNSSGSNLGPTNPQLIKGNGSEVTIAPNTPPPAGSTPVPGKPHTYYVPGTYLGVKTYAELFRKENGLSRNRPLTSIGF